ncbi:MAG TPA: 5'/3'-nucleotidase SurE [Spirochaetota bacterium]|nr:5'/3'-nucleotidase SurE [Spirochaetota bacterium]HPC39498.1 5'/3'-nucleotidase SurE [Spirochaetota bacterium]HPL16294.1 5'/3'-nucleotidase SurE [Spirochaetota bacterium]HQF06835.1 5'/3'-nucleotidase SurE [Spirochaetota bacterium]HQH95546.1 5'/3'-nucleotidase SurE [Spirochaetota bacterium]
MNILLTNDDGIQSEGINSLFTILSGRHTVFMIAPKSEQSACSNAITVRTQLKIKKVTENRYSVSGFPADCVIIGLSGTFLPEIDLVVSGINHGPNVGDDLVFSGTVGAARTGYLFGKSAIAISIDSYHRPSRYADDASRFLLEFIDTHIDGDRSSPVNDERKKKIYPPSQPFYNINYPDLPAEKIKGKKMTYVGRRMYRDSFTKTQFELDEAIVQMGGYIESIQAEGSDTTELEKGFISITPLMTDCTNYDSLKKFLG